MRKLLTLALSISLFTFSQAKAGESDALIATPKNGDCVVMIVQSANGNDSDLKFLQAIQDYLENGYVAKSSFSTAERRSGKKQFYIPLYKEDC